MDKGYFGFCQESLPSQFVIAIPTESPFFQVGVAQGIAEVHRAHWISTVSKTKGMS
jgi:hypothetical protein